MRSASAAGPVIGAPVGSRTAALPAVWSGCQWVFQIAVARQPRASSAASTGPASPGSTTTVSSPECISQT